MPKEKNTWLINTTVIVLFMLGVYVSIEFIYVLLKYLSTEYEFVKQNESAKIVYFHIVFVSAMYLIFVVGFFYSSFSLLQLKRKGAKIGMVLAVFNIILLIATCVIRWEAGLLDLINFLLSSYVVYSLIWFIRLKRT